MIDTQEIAVTLRVPVEGESTRAGIATLVRGFGEGVSLEKIFYILLPLFAFLMHFGPEFRILVLIWNRQHLHIRNGTLT